MSLSRVIGLVLLLGGMSLPAQETGEPDKPPPPPRRVRFLPVGDAPPFRQEIRDGVRYELEPPAGSIPPREVLVGFGDDEEASGVPLLLGRITDPLKAPGGGGPMQVRRRQDGADTEPWMRVTRPEEGDFLVLLWRGSSKGTWEKARALVLPDSAGAAPAGRMRVVNLSRVDIGVIGLGENIKLPPGKVWQRAVPVGKDTEIHLGAVDVKGKLKRFHSGAVFQNPGERTLIVAYEADGVDRGRPLKAVVRREPLPKEMKPEEPEAAAENPEP